MMNFNNPDNENDIWDPNFSPNYPINYDGKINFFLDEDCASMTIRDESYFLNKRAMNSIPTHRGRGLHRQSTFDQCNKQIYINNTIQQDSRRIVQQKSFDENYASRSSSLSNSSKGNMDYYPP
ncbi:hypothetical protein HZS_5020, partial [Henneguya salminicola]